MKMKALDKTLTLIAALGAIDLGFFAFDYELIEKILGYGVTAKVIFFIIGISGIYLLIKAFK